MNDTGLPQPAQAELVVDVDWPYDAALSAQHATRDAVIAADAGGVGVVYVGSHREEVVTLGRHAPEAQLVARAALDDRGVIVRRIERGGGATAHGPGQLVVYPVIHLERARLDVPRLTDALLAAAVAFAADNGVAAEARVDAASRTAGVFTTDGGKLASIGFRVERGVVTHGLAVNVDNDLSLFDLIAPCGISRARMSSIASVERSGGTVSNSLIDHAHRLSHHVSKQCVLAFSVTRLTGGNRDRAEVGGVRQSSRGSRGNSGSGSGTGAHA